MQGKTLSIGLRAVLAIIAATLFVTSTWAAAQERVLLNFNGQDGRLPQAGLIFDAAGNLYGTTEGGGTGSNCGAFGCGTVFELTPAAGGGWTETVLYSFGGSPDGADPLAGLIFDAAGNLYGTTGAGGTYDYGTVFELTPAAGGGWTETVLHNFNYNVTDGYYPYAGLIFDAAGNLYGTTSQGGTYGYGWGTVFELTPAAGGGWTEKVLHSFPDYNGTDGTSPYAGLIFDAAGNLYGTTSQGGTYIFRGTVFELTPAAGGGWTETVLHSFGNGADADSPQAGLIFDAAGNLYGTTVEGGTGSNCIFGCGTVFELTPAAGGGWTEKVLYSFNANGTDGYYPYAGLIFDAAGNLYGTTRYGGTSSGCAPYGCGTVFELTPAAGGTWTETVLHNFGNGTDGATPLAGLIFDAAGNLYGTTSSGGTYGYGTVFELQVPATYSLTVSTTGNGTVTSTDGFISCPGTCSHSYPPNTQVTLNATPSGGWTFSGWSGACSGTGSCVVTMTQSLSVGATFTQNPIYYTLTVTTSGNGTVTSTDGYITCPGTCSHSYPLNTQVTLNATPGQGWVFGGWDGACLGTGSCTVTMTQPLSVDAIFSQALQFVPLSQPCRAVDTRPPNGNGPIQGNTHQDFPISGEGNCATLPNAAVYSTNVTVVPATRSLGYLTIWPAGEPQPVVSTLNSVDGRVKADAAIVPAGTGGAVSIYVTDTTNVIVDVNGYFAPLSGSTLAFYPLAPCRVADTRKSSFPTGLGPPSLTGGQPRDFPILNATSCNIPSTAAAYSLNFTVVPSGTLGYLTVWPTGQTRPTVSTLNDVLGRVIANAAIVVAGTGSDVSAYATNNTDLVIDINGYFAPAGADGLSLYAVAPCRVIDTRHVGSGQPFTGTLNPPVDVVNSQCGVSSLAQAYVFNATVIPVHSLGYLTLWPDGENQPVVSTLNAQDGSLTNNMAIVPAGTAGKVDAYANGLTQLILDISSYFAP